MIKVECVACKSPYDVDERRIPEKGMKMRCPKCNTSFMVDRAGAATAIDPAGAAAPKPAAAKYEPAPVTVPMATPLQSPAKLDAPAAPKTALFSASMPPNIDPPAIAPLRPDPLAPAAKKPPLAPPPTAAAPAPASNLTQPLDLLSEPPPSQPGIPFAAITPATAVVKQPSAAGAFGGLPNVAPGVAAAAFKKTLVGQQLPGNDPAPAPKPLAKPVGATFVGVAPAASSPESKPSADDSPLADLPAVKPAAKPATPWGSLAPPSMESKASPQRPAAGGLPKGSMGVQNAPLSAAGATAAKAAASAGSAFGAASARKTMLGPAHAAKTEFAFGEPTAELELDDLLQRQDAAPLELADLPAPLNKDKSKHRPAPEQPVIDLPAAKPDAANAAFGFKPAAAKPRTAAELPVVDLPAAKIMPPSAAAGRAKPANTVAEPPLVDLPAAKPTAGSKLFGGEPPVVDLPAPKTKTTAASRMFSDSPLVDLPTPKAGAAPKPFGAPPKPAPKPSLEPPVLDLPTPKLGPAPGFGAKAAPAPSFEEEPLIDLPGPIGLDLPVAKPARKGTLAGTAAPSMPADSRVGDLDLDAPEEDLEAGFGMLDELDLPAPKGISDLPAPRGIADLPAPKGIADLPAPRGIADLPTPKGFADLPGPRGIADLPVVKPGGGFGELDLPMPKLAAQDEASFGDLDLPELPVLPGFGNIELPMPRAGGDVMPPKQPTYQGMGMLGEDDFGGLNTGDSADLDLEANLNDMRSDDLLQLKEQPFASAGMSVPAALQAGDEDYGEAGLLDDEPEENMEFGIAEGEATEDGFALPPELLRRNKGEQAQAADVARGKRAVHVLIGVAVLLLLAAGAGAALSLTNYGFFGMYYLERYLPEAGDERFAHEAIGRAEKTAVSDTYRDAQRSLALLGEARHKAGLNRELLTRSLLHESLFMVRFGANPTGSAHAASILRRLEERHGMAPGMDLARAADAARRGVWGDAEKFLTTASTEAPQDPYVGLLAGEVALRQGKLAEAEKAFAEALKHGGGARAQWGLARVALSRTDDAARNTAVEETLKLSPLHAEARLADARILWAQGKEERALHEVRQALGQEPISDQYLWTSKLGKADGLSLLGYIHESRGRLHLARKAYEEALAADPYLVEALLGAGRVLLRERRWSDALARFESGLNLAQKSGSALVLSGRRADIEARLGQGRAQLALTRAQEAKATLSALMTDGPNDAEIVLAAGQAEDALGNQAAAEELLKKAVELAPTTFASYLALSQHYFKLSQADKASETLNEAATKVAENVEMRRMLGQSELARSRFDSAVHEYKRAVELDPQDMDAQFGLAVAYRKTGDLDKSRALLEQIGTRDPQFGGLALERGQLLEAQGDYPKAVESYRAARDKDPSDTALSLRLGAAQVEAGALDDADSTLQQVMRETPNSAEAEYFTGRLALARGRGPDALTHFDRALSLDNSQAQYHLYAARAALEMTNLGRALEEAESSLTRDPKAGDAYWIRGIVRMRSGAVKDALKDAKRALELNPKRFDAYALMAESYDDLRQQGLAAESWRAALAQDPQRGEWWYRLGRLYLDMGSRPQGNEALEKAVALGDKQDPMPYWLPDSYRLMGEVARATNNPKLAVTLFKRYLATAPDGALDRDDVRKLLKSWDVDVSED